MLAPSTSPLKPKPLEERGVGVVFFDPSPAPDNSVALKTSTHTVGGNNAIDIPPGTTSK
jgi:hypothetical protein